MKSSKTKKAAILEKDNVRSFVEVELRCLLNNKNVIQITAQI